MKHVMSAYVNHAWFSSSTQQVLSKEGKVSYSTGSRLTDKESDALPTVPHRPCLPFGYSFYKESDALRTVPRRPCLPCGYTFYKESDALPTVPRRPCLPFGYTFYKESDALPTVPRRPCLPCGYTFVKQCIVVSLNCAPNAKTHTPVVGSETYRTNVN